MPGAGPVCAGAAVAPAVRLRRFLAARRTTCSEPCTSRLASLVAGGTDTSGTGASASGATVWGDTGPVLARAAGTAPNSRVIVSIVLRMSRESYLERLFAL